jgi:hypothetical protein
MCFIFRVMRRILFICLVGFIHLPSAGQFIPEGMSYQAVAREVGGDEIIDQNLTVRIGILKGSADGDLVYEEVHDVLTNSFGLFTLSIGEGVPTGNAIYPDLTEIPFYTDAHFLRIDVDTPQSSGFEFLGTSELLAVPYAFHANTAGSAPEIDGDVTNELIDDVTMNGLTLTISEGGIDHTVSLAALQGGSGGGAGLIDNITLEESNLIITEGAQMSQVDLEPLASTRWQKSNGAVHNASDLIGIGTTDPTSRLTLAGALAVPVHVFAPSAGNTATPFDLGPDHYALICDVSSGEAELHLPNAITCPGRLYQLRKKSDAMGIPYSMTIVSAPGELVDGTDELQYNSPLSEFVTLISDGTTWHVLNYSVH